MKRIIQMALIIGLFAVTLEAQDKNKDKDGVKIKDKVLKEGSSRILGNFTSGGKISEKKLDGIPVYIKGTTTKTTTQKIGPYGTFEFQKIPSGKYVLCFKIEGTVYQYPFSISDGSTLFIRNISITKFGRVDVEKLMQSKN